MDDLSKPPTQVDSLDALLREAVSAPAVLVPGAVIGEHYQIERVLGMGGMGTVYLARDLDLARPVAIKVHRIATDSSRLHREAVAMARLSHPNVVTVFEVGDHEGHPFVAMEYVEGEDLRSWLARGERSRGEVLDALLVAGTGLAAAHHAELVHRDVKPDNILIGRDGRVRIGDFGLAQAAETGAPLHADLGDATATGAVVGTPAYMAPEQIDGGLVDARTDQFAFCVAAWESLCGGRPFDGANTEELRAATERGIPVAPKRAIPSGLRQVLLRGLAAEPAKRWPSMPALLHALRAARRRRWVMFGAIGVLALAAPIVAWAAWPGPDPLLACDTRASTLELVVPPVASTALVEAARIAAGPTNKPLSTPLAATIAGHYARAVAVADTVCRADVTGKWSADMVAASAECTFDNALAVREILGSIPPTRQNLPDLLLVANNVPAIEPCADPSVLAGWRSLAPGVIELRAQVARALAQVDTGRIAEARTIATALARSPLAAEHSVQGRVALLQAMLELASGEYAAAEKRLAEAYLAARSGEDPELALRLVSELIYITTGLRRDAVAGERWVAEGLADAKREQARYAAEAANVYEAAAQAAIEAGDSQVALQHAELAETILHQLNPKLHEKLQTVRGDALADLGRFDQALASSDARIRDLKILFGERHPTVAVALGDRAALLLDVGREEEALPAVYEAIAIMDATAEDHAASVTPLQITVGATLLAVGNPAGAKYLAAARRSRVAEFGEDHPDIALIDTNLALVYLDAGDQPQALAALHHAIAVQEKFLGPDHLELAVGLYNLAVAERDAKHYEAAVATIERAVKIYEKRQPGSGRHAMALGLVTQIENVAGHPARAVVTAEAGLAIAATADLQVQAWLRLELARALFALRSDPARIRTLLAQARVAYAAENMTARVAEIDAFVAKLR